MNITKEQWQKIVSILLSAAIAIAAVLGWQIGVQPLLFPGSSGYGVQAVRERIGLDTPIDTYFYNGADVTLYSDHHSTQKIKLDGGTGAITAASLTMTGAASQGPLSVTGGVTATGHVTANAVYIGANAFTGPARMISATVSNDTYVAHGFSGVQPKVVCSPFAGGLFTYTVFISATNAVSFSVGLADQVGNTAGAGSWVVNCIAQP